MRRTTRTILLRYGGAVVFTALAVLLRKRLAVYRPATLAAILCPLAGTPLFVEPRAPLALDSARTFAGLPLCPSSFPIIAGFAYTTHAGPCFCEPHDVTRNRMSSGVGRRGGLTPGTGCRGS
jgi:hypothetical protein